jgi:uncharacterized protein YkwD
MSDPTRWADDTEDATALEQELFRSGRAVVLPAEEKRRHWLAITEQVALLPAASAPGAPPGLAGKAVAKVAGAGWLKALALMPVLAGAGAGAYALTHSAPNRAPAPTEASAPAAAPGATAKRDERGDSPAGVAPQITTGRASEAVLPHDDPGVSAPSAPLEKAATTPARARNHVVSGAPAAPAAEESVSARPSEATRDVEAAGDVATTSHLAEEARAVLDARNALRAGNPSAALRILDEARVRFSNGSLGQEREALTIEALARAGRRDAASARARTFLTRFPRSPLASNVRRFE